MSLINIFKRKKDREALTVATQAKAVSAIGNKKEKIPAVLPTIKSSKKVSEQTDRVIIKPLITEKSAILAHANQYAFVVNKKADQVQVRNAIKELYGVLPTRVNIQVYYGKTVHFGRRQGKRQSWKKAIVTLPPGSKIDVYEGV